MAMATAHTDGELLAELVGDALGETVKSVKSLVVRQEKSLREAQADTQRDVASLRKSLTDWENTHGSALQRLTGELQAQRETTDAAVKALRTEINLEPTLDQLRRLLVDNRDFAEKVGGDYRKSLQDASDQILHYTQAATGLLERIREVEQRFDAKLEALRVELQPERWVDRLLEIIKQLPAPVVQSEIHLPEIKLPEIPPTPVELKVTVPPPRLVEKLHEYDTYNRPIRTIERELKEAEEVR